MDSGILKFETKNDWKILTNKILNQDKNDALIGFYMINQ